MGALKAETQCTPGWADDLQVLDVAKRLYLEGRSGGFIAKQLKRDFHIIVTRNAVLGKLYREGVLIRSPASSPAIAPPPRVANDQQLDRQQIVRLIPVREYIAEIGQHLPGHRQCKWPIGDPGEEGFHFCSSRAKPGRPYCVEHCRVAYKPPERRRQDGRMWLWR